MKAKLNTNPKARRYILLTFLLILSLATLSCVLLGGGDEESKSQATQPPAGPSDKELQAVSPDTLDSYRGRMTSWAKLKDGSQVTETKTMEWVQEPRTGHYIYTKANGETEEEIFIGDTVWEKVGVDSWTPTGSGHPPGGDGFLYMAYAHDILVILPHIPGGSGSLPKGATLVGEETTNGIHCKHYAYDWSHPPFASQLGSLHFEVWVADQSDFPPVIVRVLQQQSQHFEDTDVIELKTEINLYDFNAPITIELSGDIVAQPPIAQPTEPSAGLQLASLNMLDSYRGRITIWIKLKDGSELTETSTLEWVREPPAGHYVHTKSNGDVEEQIVIGDTKWEKVGVDSWTQMSSSQGPGGQGFEYIAAPIIHSTLAAIGPDGSGSLSKGTLVGEETVNGIHCKHYAYDESTLLWVADQSDLPPVIVRVLFQASPSEASNVLEAKQELDVYDLNAPITIEPPQ